MDTGGGLAATATAMTQFIHHNAVWGLGGRAAGYTRTGGMPGTSSLASSRWADGIDYAFIFNTRHFLAGDADPVGDLNTTLSNLFDHLQVTVNVSGKITLPSAVSLAQPISFEFRPATELRNSRAPWHSAATASFHLTNISRPPLYHAYQGYQVAGAEVAVIATNGDVSGVTATLPAGRRPPRTVLL